MNTRLATVLILSFTSVAFSEDFKTVNGKEYKDATITRVEPDGIVVKTKSGITKVYFAELPKEVQERFHYDQQKAREYSAEQAANYTAYQKQQENAEREREDAAARNNAILAQQEAAKNRTQALQARYDELQKQEDDLLRQIGEAKEPGPAYYGGKNNRTLLHQPEPTKIPATTSSEPPKRRPSRKNRGQKATGESAALTLRAPKAMRGCLALQTISCEMTTDTHVVWRQL